MASVSAAASPAELTVAPSGPTAQTPTATVATPIPAPTPTVVPSQTPASTPEPTASQAPASPSPEPSPSVSTAVATIFAGGGTDDPGDGGPATSALLRHPSGIAVGPDGTVWIVDNNSYLLRSVSTDGLIHTNAKGFEGPQGVAVSRDGAVYVADRGSYRVVRVAAKGKLLGVAGDPIHPGFRGDGGPAKRAWLWQPYDVATDSAGNLYIADTSNQRIRMVDATTGKIRTIAGNGKPGFTGDGGPATDAELYNPEAIAVDAAGTVLYIADYTNARLRRVDLVTEIITTVAGVGSGSVSYDPALTGPTTPLTRIIAVALDTAGNVYLPVFYNNLGTLVMRLDPSGTMTRVVGGGTSDDLGVPVSEYRLPTVEALEINPFTGALLICVGDGRVLAIPDVAAVTVLPAP